MLLPVSKRCYLVPPPYILSSNLSFPVIFADSGDAEILRMRDGPALGALPKVPMEAASIERIRSLCAGYVLRSAPAVLPSHGSVTQASVKLTVLWRKFVGALSKLPIEW
jgi:hypothetical protein